MSVPRDTPGKYVVKVMVKPPAPAGGGAAPAPSQEVTRLNIWIVWASGHAVHPFSSLGLPGSNLTGRMGDDANSVAATGVASSIGFDFVLSPPSIVITNGDIPNLADNRGLVPVPGSKDEHPIYSGTYLATGANSRWDVSRKVSFQVRNPGSVPLQYFPPAYAKAYKPNVPPSGVLVEFPKVEALGNDDTETKDESNNPWHDPCHVTSRDTPQLFMSAVVPPIAGSAVASDAALEMELDFREFVRLQIGERWYEVSDPVEWNLTLKLKLQNNVWADQGSTIFPTPTPIHQDP